MAESTSTTTETPAAAPTATAPRKEALDTRNRYLDMVQKERNLFVDLGINRTIEQLLVNAAGVESNPQKDATGESRMRSNATGDQIRTSVPAQSWTPLSIFFIDLKQGVLRMAALTPLTERQQDNLLNTLRRSGFDVQSVEYQVWDRTELTESLRRVHDLSADRCEKTLSEWLRNLDNSLLLNQFMKDMLSESLQMRASDIHITQDNMPDAPNWIKYRIDGDLVPMHILPSEAMARLTTLLKRDAGMNFGDRRTPQDGRISFIWQGRNIDIRVAAASHSQDGEKITMRLLDRTAMKGFEDLFRKQPFIRDKLAKLLDPDIKGEGGLVIISGPTGSGKSTTMYAAMQHIDRRKRHVLTIEDPIEYELRYATQWQVSAGHKGTEFADLIKASLRHDPDFIIIGEMRDGETVETGLRASESGHTVISTVHADSAVQTLERLRSFMPIERDRSCTYTLAQQIKAVLNQRLIKTLCQGCSVQMRASEYLNAGECELLHLEPAQLIRRHNPNGCDLCNRTGYLGRTSLLDAMLIDGTEAARNGIFDALMTNAAKVAYVPGVTMLTRADNIRQLVTDCWIDPRTAISLLRTLGEKVIEE